MVLGFDCVLACVEGGVMLPPPPPFPATDPERTLRGPDGIVGREVGLLVV